MQYEKRWSQQTIGSRRKRFFSAFLNSKSTRCFRCIHPYISRLPFLFIAFENEVTTSRFQNSSRELWSTLTSSLRNTWKEKGIGRKRTRVLCLLRNGRFQWRRGSLCMLLALDLVRFSGWTSQSSDIILHAHFLLLSLRPYLSFSSLVLSVTLKGFVLTQQVLQPLNPQVLYRPCCFASVLRSDGSLLLTWRHARGGNRYPSEVMLFLSLFLSAFLLSLFFLVATFCRDNSTTLFHRPLSRSFFCLFLTVGERFFVLGICSPGTGWKKNRDSEEDEEEEESGGVQYVSSCFLKSRPPFFLCYSLFFIFWQRGFEMEGSVYEVDDTASSLAGGDAPGVPTVPRGQVRKVKNTKSGQEEDKIVLKLRACISCRLIMSEQQVRDFFSLAFFDASLSRNKHTYVRSIPIYTSACFIALYSIHLSDLMNWSLHVIVSGLVSYLDEHFILWISCFRSLAGVELFCFFLSRYSRRTPWSFFDERNVAPLSFFPSFAVSPPQFSEVECKKSPVHMSSLSFIFSLFQCLWKACNPCREREAGCTSP